MKQLFYCSLLLVFLFASCQGADVGEPDPKPDPGSTRTVQFDLSSLSSAAAAALQDKDFTFLFYQDGRLLLRSVKSLDSENKTQIDVPLDEATQLIVIAGGTIKNPDLLETLEITTGTEYDQEIFATPVTNVTTNGTPITLVISRQVGKVGILPTDSDQALAGASFDALEVSYNKLITGYRPGAGQDRYVYQTVTRRATRAEGYQSSIMAIVHPADAESEDLTRIDLDYYQGNQWIGRMAEAQPLSGIAVKASVNTLLKLSLISAFNPASRNLQAEPASVSVIHVEF